MKQKEGYMSIRYWKRSNWEESTEVLKILPFHAIDIVQLEYVCSRVIVKKGSASVDLRTGYGLHLDGYYVEDLIKYINKLGEVYGSYGNLAEHLGKRAIDCENDYAKGLRKPGTLGI